MGRSGPGERPRGGMMMTDRQMEQLTKELNLTKEQQDKIRKLLTDHQDQVREQMHKTMTENREKIMALRKQYDEARETKDKEKIKALDVQMRELRTGKDAAARQKLSTDIAAVLTDEQKPKFEKIKADVFNPPPPLQEQPEVLWRAVESLNLPSEKSQKIKGIVDEWKTASREAKSKDEKANKAAAAEVYKKVMAELTPEQQTKVKEWRGPMGMGMRGHGGEGWGARERKGEGKGPKHEGAEAPEAGKPKE